MASVPGVGAMAYDGRNRWQGVAPGQTTTRGYDPSNRKIWTSQGDEILVDFFLPTGEKLGTYQTFTHNGHGPDGTNGAEACSLGTNGQKFCIAFRRMEVNYYFAGRLVKKEPTAWYQPDRLESHAAHHPYGEPRGANWSATPGFATYWRETNGLDYAVNRYYSSTYGRFTSPDPYRASAALTNPQSWNRYAYVEGDPVNKIDPLGLDSYSLMHPGDWIGGGGGWGWSWGRYGGLDVWGLLPGHMLMDPRATVFLDPWGSWPVIGGTAGCLARMGLRLCLRN